MRQTPIFDTNIFGHVQDGLITQSDWRYLLRHRPGHGWPLSAVTVMELLAGFGRVTPEKFFKMKEQVELAVKLSNGRVFEEPNYLLCTKILSAPFPAHLERASAEALALSLEVVCRAKSLAGNPPCLVPYKGGRAGFPTSVFGDLVAGPKKDWVDAVEAFADGVYPSWREHFKKTGKRVPPEIRKELGSRSVSQKDRHQWVEVKLKWLEADAGPELVNKITPRLDAVLEFTSFVAREFLTGNYALEKHASDVYDQFQLHYLAMDRFIIVSQDADLSKRTSRSCQTERIMSFETFLQTL